LLPFVHWLILLALALPALAAGIMSVQQPVPLAVIVISCGASAVALAAYLFSVWVQKSKRAVAVAILDKLKTNIETRDKLVEPLKALAQSSDPGQQVLHLLADRLCRRREQLRSTLDKLNEIMTNVSINKSIEYKEEDFDIPDSDDRLILLGTLGQLISTLNQSRQRGDVFAKVLRESPIAMLITGPRMEIRSMNPAAEKLLGCSQQKVLFRSFTDFFVAPPIKELQSHLKGIVLPGMLALAELKNGSQEVFTTIRSKDGVMKLIGLRASFGSNCLFVMRERSREKQADKSVTPESMPQKKKSADASPEPLAG
jgi:PAS domain S-box-containing protein